MSILFQKISKALLVALCAFSAAAHCSPVYALPGTVHDETLPNGLRLIVQTETDTPLVAMDVFIKTAGAREDAAHPGLANITANVLLSGTTQEDPATLKQHVGQLGGNVTAFWDRNYTQVRTLTLASSFNDAAYLLSDVMKNASYTDTAISDARAHLRQQLQERADDVFDQAYDQLKTKLYAGEGITPDPIGDPQMIKHDISADDIRRFYQKYYTADNVVISVVGNIDPDTAIKVLEEDFGDMRASAKRLSSAFPSEITPITGPRVVKSFRGDITAGYVMVGYVVPGAGRSEYPALMLVNALLGGMKTSLLFSNLRIAKGLGYETASLYGEDVGVSDLTGYILSSGDPKTIKPKLTHSSKVLTTSVPEPSSASANTGPTFTLVTNSLLDQFKTMRDQPPTPTMLARAKKFVIGTYLIGHERLADRAYWLGYSEIALKPLGGYRFDTGFADAINAVTGDDIQSVAQKYLSEGYVLSMVLPGDPDAGEVSK